VAHGHVSIRWSGLRGPSYSLAESGNVVPVLAIAALLIVHGSGYRFSRLNRRWHCSTVYLSGVLAIGFVLLLHWAMWHYSGGSMKNGDPASYSWGENFLSDLGREYCFHDDRNASAFAFQLAMSLAGAGMVLYVAGLPGLFRRSASQRLAVIGMVCGVIAGWSCARIGWAPVDTSYHQHNLFVLACFTAFEIMGFSMAGAILLEPEYPKRYGWSMLAACFALGAYLVLRHLHFGGLFFGDGFARHIVAQKLAVYCLILCMAYQSWGSISWLKRQVAGEGFDGDGAP
jgi:hypothetical protein